MTLSHILRAANREYTDQFVTTLSVDFTNQNSHTFTGANLAGGTTKVIVIAMTTAPASVYTASITTATIAGVSATVYKPASVGAFQQTAILVATGITAQSGNIVLNFSHTFGAYSGAFCTIRASVYTTPRSTGFQYTSAGRASSTKATLSAAANAIVDPSSFVVSALSADDIVSMNGTGLTYDYNQLVNYGIGESQLITANRKDVSSSFNISSSIAIGYGTLSVLTIQ